MQLSLSSWKPGAMMLPVSRLLAFLLGIVLLLSMATGAVAHANEQICSPGAEAATLLGHADGDTDQLPDTETGAAHHHSGCHGHHVAAPVDHKVAAGSTTSRSALLPGVTTAAASVHPAATLRPPIA